MKGAELQFVVGGFANRRSVIVKLRTMVRALVLVWCRVEPCDKPEMTPRFNWKPMMRSMTPSSGDTNANRSELDEL